MGFGPHSWGPQHGHYGPAWGYDGDDLVIVFRWSEGRGIYGGSLYTVLEDGTDLTLLSPSAGDGDGIGGERIAYDTSPAVSPDGTRVAYATLRHSVSEGRLDIVTAALNGTERQQLTQDRETQHEPSWSPDGTRIAFLWRWVPHTMAADGSDVRNLAGEMTAVSEPAAWSPDGTRLAFRESVTEDLYVVGADGSNLTRVAEGPVGRPAWSPDGRLAFATGVEVGEGRILAPTVPPASPIARGERAIVVMDADGSNMDVLIEDGFEPRSLWWSPDGRELLAWGDRIEAEADGTRSAERRLYSFVLETKEAREFTVSIRGTHRSLRDIGNLAWSPDGSRIVVLFPNIGSQGLPLRLFSSMVLVTVARDGSDLRVLVREDRESKLEAAGGIRP